MALMLLVGTTNGLWEIGTHATRRWPWQRQHLRHVLTNQTIAALTRHPAGGAVAITADGALWQCAPGQRWRRQSRHAAPTAKHPYAATTALAVALDGGIWRGTSPVSLWHAGPTMHAACAWQPCDALTTQFDAAQWWGPGEPTAPLVTAIAPDPRDAQAVTLAIAVGGVYHTADGGQTWQAQHDGIAPLLRPDTSGDAAPRQVVQLALHPRFPDLLYAMSDTAIYRADTGSASWWWEDITPPHACAALALPGQITPDPHKRDTAFAVLPLVADEAHCTLWQTHDGGITWQELADAPVLPTPLISSATAEAATIAVAISPSAPEQIALVTPDGDVYLAATSDTTQWRHLATDLGTVTGVSWAERYP